ncbi:MASE4 domain-containing protein [Acidisphaera sp. L21]|uniref:MASE4 domain-containing protein n=1 Tax=Acidisphaera sp. L21 TaxID=1641851 RepID=UPI00131D5D1E|nr:MASE4 domain-containing protein [Acidisphaera sp. L21]
MGQSSASPMQVPLPGAARPLLETFATKEAGCRSRRIALVMCVLFLVPSLAMLPVVGNPIPPVPGFMSLNQSALVLIYGLTAWLFLAQYRRIRSVPLLVLGAGGLFTTLMVAVQLVCTPNLLTNGLLVGRGPATLTWLWTFWHLGPPLFALPYAIMEGDGRVRYTAPKWVSRSLWATVAIVTICSAAIAVLVTEYVEYLPNCVEADGGYRALTTSGVGPALLFLNVAALVVLCWTTRLRSMLQLWLAVSLFLLVLDNVITDAAAMRATVGWFAGRMEALVAALVMLGVYLREIDFLHHQAEETALEREQARAEAQSARENLEIALDASEMGDWELDIASDTSRRTLRHDRIFGYADLQPIWGIAHFMSHVHPADRNAAGDAIEAAFRDGRLELECRIRRADDAIRWVALWGRTSYDAEGRPVSFAGCLMDTTKRRETEERLRLVERMEAIGQLSGGIAHDFNNLLTVILGSLDLIVRRPDDAARVERLARSAFIAGRRGTELTEKLLSFSRRQVLQTETLNPNRLVGEFLPLMQRGVGETIQIQLDLDPQLDPARIDPNQLQAALLNLAGNARDAMPGGGTLTIATRNVTITSDDRESARGLSPGPYLRISITDDGTGMDANTAARAFEPFFTTKEIGKGTGLGLSQVYGFVQQAGGQCQIDTSPGLGCTVAMYLPRSTEVSRTAPNDNVVPLRRATGGEVVLVVEDDETVREMAAESLEALGYGVQTASDARIALDLLRDTARVDILFSDVVMPGGMNGAQLANEARKLRPGLKVLLTSGYTVTATGGARELPQDVPLLRKPYLREDLAAKLQTLSASQA